MKRFTFTLATLLNLREQALEQATQAFGQASQRHEAAAKAADHARQQVRLTTRHVLMLREAAGTPVGEHRQAIAGLQARQDALRQAEQQRMACAQEMEKARQAYFAARREVEIVEKLRERQLERFQEEMAHAEDVEREDLVQNLYQRQRLAEAARGGDFA